jgi:MinD-like ATPase involved in chromosome partitioning or flagellar assembly
MPDSDGDFIWPPDELLLGPREESPHDPAGSDPTPPAPPPAPVPPTVSGKASVPPAASNNGGHPGHPMPASPWAEPPHRTEPHPPVPPAPAGPIHRPAPTPYPRPQQPGQHPGPVPPAGAPHGSDPHGSDPHVPTADEFARRRAVRPVEPVARTGVRGAVSRGSLGLVKMPPGGREREINLMIDTVRRNFGGLRQVTVVNPKGGAGKTVAVLLLAMTFGQKRGGYVLAWDNNETQGTLGMRAQQDFHSRTVRDLLRDLEHFSGPHGRVGDLSQYVRAQGEGMFDVLASDESATAGEMLTSTAFADIREVVSRFYKLIMVDTGNNVRAANWQAAIDATDQLVVTMSARNDSAETAARMLDHLEQTGRQRLVRQAVTVVSMPPSRKDIDLPPIQRHFAARTRAVLLAPYERLIDTGEPLRYGLLTASTREAWLRVAAAVAEGL